MNGHPDPRFSTDGNVITSRQSIHVSPGGRGPNFKRVARDIRDLVYSATFRTHPERNAGNDTDFYPIKINRNSIKPGTVIYDINAHVVIVYKIDDDGLIHYVDANPDNTVTRVCL